MPRKAAASESLTASAAVAHRLVRQHLAERCGTPDLPRVVRDIGGVQAQLAGTPALALWARVADLTAAAVDGALVEQRTLVRTWAMRTTLHLLPAEDILLYAAGLRAAWRAREEQMERAGLDEPRRERVLERLARELAHDPRTRRELSASIRDVVGGRVAAALDRAFAPAVDDGCARAVLEYACGRGVFCTGPARGREGTFVLVERWVPQARAAPPPEMAEEHLLRRFLAAFGPAGTADFAYWSGLPASRASAIMGRMKGAVIEVSVDGQPAVVLREDAGSLASVRPVESVRLLPNFDPLLLGCKDKEALVDPRRYQDVFRKGGWVAATLLAAARIQGTWTKAEKGRRLVIELQVFSRLPRKLLAAVELEARSLARFLGLEAVDAVRVVDA